MEHILKCRPQYWRAVESGDKNFEVRRDDRGFQRGDILVLRRTRPESPYSFELAAGAQPDPVSGKWIEAQFHDLRRRITYVLTGGQFGIEPGYVVIGLAPEE